MTTYLVTVGNEVKRAVIITGVEGEISQISALQTRLK